MPDFRVRVGVDIVSVERMAGLLQIPAFVERNFQPSELTHASLERLAGIFAAKEALFKALEQPTRFELVAVTHDPAGRPSVEIPSDIRPTDLVSLDLSISHEREYAVAVVVALFAAVPDLVAEELGE